MPCHYIKAILTVCHDSPYGGHHVGDHTTAKVLLSGFYRTTLIKDAHDYAINCDACQLMSNIEMSIKYNLVIEPFDV